MNGNQASISPTDKLLWWLATAETELICDCVVDRNRYRIVGMSVLATWLFATLAWTYFFSTAVTSMPLYCLLGCFMGFVILTIDRTLIKGIHKHHKNKVMPLIFRALMAIAIGTFMAQPAVLYLFDKEVKLQTSLDNEVRRMQKRKELDTLYAAERTFIGQQKSALQNMLDLKYIEVQAARANFLAETDGTGGSGKLGISTIALAKKNEYAKLDGEYAALSIRLQPKIDSFQQQLQSANTAIQTQLAAFDALLNNGFLTRIQALQNLLKNSDALLFRYYLIVAILMLVELMPVIAKTLLPAGTYDERVRLREELEKELTRRNTDREQQLKEYYNEAAFTADKQAIDDFFAQNRERRAVKMDTYAQSWDKENEGQFSKLWQKIKKNVFTNWEY